MGKFLLFAIGGALLIFGLFRTFGRPQLYRGKIFGPILAAIALFVIAFFSYEIFYVLRQVPARPEQVLSAFSQIERAGQ